MLVVQVVAGGANIDRGDYLMRDCIVYCCTATSHDMLHVILNYVTCHVISKQIIAGGGR
jgi:HD superfamily phosphohydrolase